MHRILFSLIVWGCYFSIANAQYAEESLVAHFPFNGDASDVSKYAINGTVQGATLTTDRCGNENSAYYFDGIDDKIVCGTDNRNIIDKLTICAWIKTNKGDLPVFISKYLTTSDDDAGYGLRLVEDGVLTIFNRDRNNAYSTTEAIGQSLYDDEWHFVVGQIDHDVLKTWIDGKLISSIKSGHDPVDISSTGELIIGSLETPNGAGNYRSFKGIIDDIRIYNTAIDSLTIQNLMYYGCPRVCKFIKEIDVYDTLTVNIYDTIPVYKEVTVYDTLTTVINKTVYDSILVTDTLLIDVKFTEVENYSQVKIYPNPAKEFIYINTEEYSTISDHSIQIVNSLGQIVFESYINHDRFKLNIKSLGGIGTYYVQIINADDELIHNRVLIVE